MSNANTPETLAHSMAQSLLRENESLRAEVASLKEELAEYEKHDAARDEKIRNLTTYHGLGCACSYDSVDDVCEHHSPKLMALTQQLAAAKDEANTARVEAECLAASCKSATEQLAAANGLVSSWWAALMEAAGCLEQAAMSMRDEDAKRAALGAAEHARNDAHRLASLSDLPEADGVVRDTPEGWKLVPISPTKEMTEAIFARSGKIDPLEALIAQGHYMAMVAAAPDASRISENGE